MLKKGLIRTCIYEYLDDHPEIQTPEHVFKHLKSIYNHLRSHPNHGDIIGFDCYPEFAEMAKAGYARALRGRPSVFEQLKDYFKMP